MNPLFATLPTTIFDIMSGLARDANAINLGQGFPEEDGPLDVREAAAAAILAGPNQYPPMRGVPALREAVAAHYARLGDLTLDWRTEVTITSGATEAIAAALLAVVSAGDEVVVFEPMYDAYGPLIRRAGGTPRAVRLSPPHWTASDAEIAAAFTPRTRAVVLNTPLNPTASVFDNAMLARIARQCVAYDAIAISDEVWEHVTFDDVRHRSMLAAPGMRERTIKIGSAGKIFGMTGWKVGFVCAAPSLTEVVAKAHQFLTFTTPPHLQTAVAYGLGKDAAYFNAIRAGYARSKARLELGLAAEGFVTLPCAGTYFLTVDLAASGLAMKDADFAIRAVKEAGVAVIPLSAFYEGDGESRFVRLCFAKRDDTLDRGVEALAKARRLFA